MEKIEVFYEGNRRFMGHSAWTFLNESPNTFAVNIELNTFRNVLSKGGSVKILMQDNQSIKWSIDRQSELLQLITEVNSARETAGLERVDS